MPDAGGQPLLNRAWTRINVELPGEPDLSARGGCRLWGDHSVAFNRPGICDWLLALAASDSQCALASDQSNDVTREKYDFLTALNELTNWSGNVIMRTLAEYSS